MPTGKNTISLETSLERWQLCQALARRRQHSRYQQFPHEKGQGSVRRVVDNPDTSQGRSGPSRSDYQRERFAVKMAHRPGELGRASSRLATRGST